MGCVFTTTNSTAQIRHALGQPTAQIVYPKPVAASTVPRLAMQIEFHRELSPDTLIQGYDDYAFRGRIYNPDGEGLAYLNTFLPIVGEIVAFPFAAAQAIKESRQVHRFRVWYRADEMYFAHIPLAKHEDEK